MGEIVIAPEYLGMLESKCCDEKLLTVQKKDRKYGVINLEGEEIVPFGKYDWIDGFYNGFARVKIGKVSTGMVDNENKWGVINERGEEVIPCVYPNIWNFYGKNYNSIRIQDGKILKNIPFSSLVDDDDDSEWNRFSDNTWGEEQTYNEYNGSYAQDVMGYSDQTINDAFEGDPDAYWNID